MLASRFGEAFALARAASTSRTCATDGLHGATRGPFDASAARARRTGPGVTGCWLQRATLRRRSSTAGLQLPVDQARGHLPAQRDRSVAVAVR